MNYRTAILIITLLYTANINAKESLIFARAPQLSPAVISKTWTPFVKHLSEVTGTNISLRVYSSRLDFEQDISKGKVALFFGNPAYGVIAHKKHGYVPIIRSNRKLLEGIIVTRKGNGINSIEQLSGKTISFPAKNSFAASLLIRYYLDTKEGITYNEKYAGSHDNSYRNVLVGTATASAGVIRTLERENEALRNQLQVIYTTPGIKSHPVMVHPSVAKTTRQAIQSEILKLSETEEGKNLLKSIKLQNPVSASYEDDYKQIEPFVLKAYQHLLD
ncbi:MAG: phosphate/phosphite/phosphonate ABC transporter substrate-binding protein [Gammaproteobacteria bacterium]|nr:phosphate/phosphite/phosphonate ABC transporter substrate-binding protein [Gammaproteobacteria bacterium]